MNPLKKRILEISYKHQLCHLGSCLTAVDIIDEIFKVKKSEEPFILSAGHAGLALYCVIEKYGGRNAEEIFNHHGTHPDRCGECGIDCSTGSLGQGLSIAIGMALADKNKNVYCLISDGEIAEGSIWEAIRIIFDHNINNLKLYVNWNKYGAYDKSSRWAFAILLGHPLIEFRITDFKGFPFLKGQEAHYHKLTPEEYENLSR